MENLLKLIKENIVLSYIIGLFVLFGLSLLWAPLINLWYAAFAFGCTFYIWKVTRRSTKK